MPPAAHTANLPPAAPAGTHPKRACSITHTNRRSPAARRRARAAAPQILRLLAGNSFRTQHCPKSACRPPLFATSHADSFPTTRVTLHPPLPATPRVPLCTSDFGARQHPGRQSTGRSPARPKGPWWPHTHPAPAPPDGSRPAAAPRSAFVARSPAARCTPLPPAAVLILCMPCLAFDLPHDSATFGCPASPCLMTARLMTARARAPARSGDTPSPACCRASARARACARGASLAQFHPAVIVCTLERSPSNTISRGAAAPGQGLAPVTRARGGGGGGCDEPPAAGCRPPLPPPIHTQRSAHTRGARTLVTR